MRVNDTTALELSSALQRPSKRQLIRQVQNVLNNKKTDLPSMVKTKVPNVSFVKFKLMRLYVNSVLDIQKLTMIQC